MPLLSQLVPGNPWNPFSVFYTVWCTQCVFTPSCSGFWEAWAPVSMPGSQLRPTLQSWQRQDQGHGLRSPAPPHPPTSLLPLSPSGPPGHDMKIKSLEEIYLFALLIKGSEITDFFPRTSLKKKVLKNMPVQKQPFASQQTKFKAFVAIGSTRDMSVLGSSSQEQPLTSVGPALWASSPLSVCNEITGGTRSVSPILSFARWLVTGAVCWNTHSCLPPGAGLVSAPAPKKLLLMAGTDRVLHLCQGLLHHSGQLGQGHFWCHFKSIVISLLISGRRQCSPSLGIRNSLTILQRPAPEFPCRRPRLQL